jgi:hypothetical protein
MGRGTRVNASVLKENGEDVSVVQSVVEKNGREADRSIAKHISTSKA